MTRPALKLYVTSLAGTSYGAPAGSDAVRHTDAENRKRIDAHAAAIAAWVLDTQQRNEG